MATMASSSGRGAESGSSKKIGGESVTRRLQSELMSLMRESDPNATAFPADDNLFFWNGHIVGSEGTVYEGLTYELTISFPSDYPYSAPTIKFVNCWHPNVDTNGNICLDILKEKWSASYSVSTILQSLRSLLSDPNNDSPLNGHAAQLWASPEAYRATVLKKYNADSKK